MAFTGLKLSLKRTAVMTQHEFLQLGTFRNMSHLRYSVQRRFNQRATSTMRSSHSTSA